MHRGDETTFNEMTVHSETRHHGKGGHELSLLFSDMDIDDLAKYFLIVTRDFGEASEARPRRPGVAKLSEHITLFRAEFEDTIANTCEARL